MMAKTLVASVTVQPLAEPSTTTMSSPLSVMDTGVRRPGVSVPRAVPVQVVTSTRYSVSPDTT